MASDFLWEAAFPALHCRDLKARLSQLSPLSGIQQTALGASLLFMLNAHSDVAPKGCIGGARRSNGSRTLLKQRRRRNRRGGRTSPLWQLQTVSWPRSLKAEGGRGGWEKCLHFTDEARSFFSSLLTLSDLSEIDVYQLGASMLQVQPNAREKHWIIYKKSITFTSMFRRSKEFVTLYLFKTFKVFLMTFWIHLKCIHLLNQAFTSIFHWICVFLSN